jgi:hypothetical protein
MLGCVGSKKRFLEFVNFQKRHAAEQDLDFDKLKTIGLRN